MHPRLINCVFSQMVCFYKNQTSVGHRKCDCDRSALDALWGLIYHPTLALPIALFDPGICLAAHFPSIVLGTGGRKSGQDRGAHFSGGTRKGTHSMG